MKLRTIVASFTVALLGLLVGTPSFAAIGYATGHAWSNNLSVAPGGTGTSTTGLAFTNNVAAGSTLVAIVQHAADEAISCTDTQSNTWTSQFRRYSASLGFDLAVLIAKNAAAGATTVTCTWTSSVARAMILAEVTGADTSTQPAGTPGSANSSGSAPPDPGASITTTSGDLVIGVVIDASATDIAAGSGYTRQLRASNTAAYQWCIEDQTASGTGPYNPNWTTSLNFWTAGGLAIKAAAGGGGGTNSKPLLIFP